MPSFRYEASDARGKLELGPLDANTARGARARLRACGLLPLVHRDVVAQATGPQHWVQARSKPRTQPTWHLPPGAGRPYSTEEIIRVTRDTQ